METLLLGVSSLEAQPAFSWKEAQLTQPPFSCKKTQLADSAFFSLAAAAEVPPKTESAFVL